MKVRDGMTPVVLTVGPAHTLREAARMMSARRVGAAGRWGHAPVDGLEMGLDHAQREVVVALRRQYVAQPRDVIA